MNRQTALSQRNLFMEDLAAANAISMNKKKETILKRILYDEQVREQSLMSRKYFPKRNQASKKVDKVQYFEKGQWKEASSPKSVTKACQIDTKAKYRETESTPLMQIRLHHLFGNFAESEFSKQYMSYKAELPDDITKWTREMLGKIRHDDTIPRLPIPISPKEVYQV